MAGVKWKDHEIDLLYSDYPDNGVAHIMKLLPHRSKVSIQRKVERLGIKFIRKDLWTKEELECITANYSSVGVKGMEKLLPNRTYRSIKFKAHELGLKALSHFWSDEEINLLRQNYPTKGSKYCETLLSRSNISIRHQAIKLGIVFEDDSTWTEKEDNILIDNYTDFSGGYCKQFLPNRSYASINKRAERLGIRSGKCTEHETTYVYLLFFEKENLYKVGISNDIDSRRKQLGVESTILGIKTFDSRSGALQEEARLLDIMSDNLINTGVLKSGNTETFRVVNLQDLELLEFTNGQKY